jgi:serine/threonine protein kinase/outer membrane protein assembly factor BamB
MSASESANLLNHFCEEFELTWSTGDQPSISEFSGRVDEHLRDELITRLITLDIKCRQRSEVSVSVEDYRALGTKAFEFAKGFIDETESGDELPISLSPDIDSSATGVQQSNPILASTISALENSAANSALPLEETVNQQFGEYQLIEEIARGGMGIVYKAQQIKLKRTVALKMILAGQLASEQDIQRFHAEAESAAGLEHPGIVPIYEVGQLGNQHFFSMAYVEGKSLAKVLQQGPLTADRAANYVNQIANAISYAHEKNIIHRDLKPANVLLDENGRVKVTDFGLAKQTHLETSLTATGQIMGTPAYMPPEQASGMSSMVDETSDVYSIGAILYCLLTARPPFQAATPLATLTQVIEQEPVLPRALVPEIPRDLETICLKCLEKERYRRYQSAEELGDDIKRFQNNQPILARPTSKFERATRWIQNRSQPLWAATLTGVAVTIFLVIGLIGRFAYQQSLLGYVNLQTSEDEGYLVATIFDEHQQQVDRQTLPTQVPIELPAGSYRVRLSGARTMSKDMQLEVRRGSPSNPTSRLLSLKGSQLWPAIQHEGNIEFLELERGADAILVDDQSITRLDGTTGETIWRTNVDTLSETLGSVENFRWWTGFRNFSNGRRQLRRCPKLLQPAVDLDHDGIRDLVFSGSEQAWLMAFSGKSGKALWFRVLAEEPPKKWRSGSSTLRSAVVHQPVALADVDQDGVEELLTTVFDCGGDKQTPPRRWLELTSGKTGEQIWTADLNGAWFDESKVPLDLRWLHSGSGISAKSKSASRVNRQYSVKRVQSFQSGSSYYSTSPVLRGGKRNPDEIQLLAGDRLVRVQVETGKIEAISLGFAPIKSPEVADLDNDGNDELLFLVNGNVKTHPTELIVWSTLTDKVAWSKKLRSTWGAVRKQGMEIASWPYVVDLNGDGQAEIIVPDSTTFGDSSAPKPYGGLSAFDAAGKLIWERELISMREQLDRFVAGPDVNDDGWRDMFVITDEAMKTRFDRNNNAIIVDAISGRDGQKLWWNRQVLESDEGSSIEGEETLRWWNNGNDGWPTLLAGFNFDIFAFSPRTGAVTGIGHHIDSTLVADGDGDGLDDLFFLRKGNIVSYRGRPQINWMRSPIELSRSADVDSDGINDFAVGEKLISGGSGKKRWSFPRGGMPLLGDAPNLPMNQMPTVQMHLLEHDINNDGFKEVLAGGESFLSSGMVGQSYLVGLLSGDDGTVLWKALPSASNKMTFSSTLTHVQSEMDSAGKVEITGIVRESQMNEIGHTWLVRLKGNTGETKWKVPLFADAVLNSHFKLVHKDFNNDGIQDILAPSAAKTDSAGVVKTGRLQLRAYDGRDGSLIWEVPVVQLADHQIDSFPTLTVVDTDSDGVVVAFYDHRFTRRRQLNRYGTNASLRVIHGATGQNIGHPLEWTEPMPNPNINGKQLPWPVVIKNRNKGEHFFACSVWTSNPAVATDWNGRELERGPLEEVLVMDAQGKIVTRFALPLIRGNKFHLGRQRLWSHDTNQDGIDELIFLDHAGLTAINPFSKERVWYWEPPQSLDLRLHAKRERPMESAIGVVSSDREVFGIDLSNGTTDWIASDKTSHKEQFPREDIYLLDCEDGAPRVLFLNDKETVCVTSRSNISKSNGEMLPVPLERMAQNDPRNRRYLPWVQGIPFWHATEPATEALKQIFELLIVLPLLSVFVIFPWFWFKQIIRRRQFTIRSLLLLIALAALEMLFFSDKGPIPDALTFRLTALGVGLVALLPPVVFIYSVVRMLLLGQWRELKWWSAVMLFLTLGFVVVAVGIAMMDFAPEEVYWYDHSWTLILWLGYCTGAFLMAFEFARICWIVFRYLTSAIQRPPRPPATV